MKAFIVLAIACISVASAGVPDFFWREYEGEILPDMVKVAQNGSDEPVYVGQGYFDDVGLLPGMLKEGVVELTAVVNGTLKTIHKDIKIMASFSPRPDIDLQWISVNYDNLESFQNLTILNVVTGGIEFESDVYIGRHSEAGYTNIGKVSTVEHGLVIPNAQGEVSVYKTFDVLAILTFECYRDDDENNSEESD